MIKFSLIAQAHIDMRKSMSWNTLHYHAILLFIINKYSYATALRQRYTRSFVPNHILHAQYSLFYALILHSFAYCS